MALQVRWYGGLRTSTSLGSKALCVMELQPVIVEKSVVISSVCQSKNWPGIDLTLSFRTVSRALAIEIEFLINSKLINNSGS